MKKAFLLFAIGFSIIGLQGCAGGSNDCEDQTDVGRCDSDHPYSCDSADYCYATKDLCGASGECD